MLFGLTNDLSTFQSLMNNIFRPHLRKFVLVFFNDSRTWQELLFRLKTVLRCLQQNLLYAKVSKCRFGCAEVEYLGHVISKNGISVDKKKLESIASLPLPKNPKAMRGFLGLTGCYWKFIKNYGGIAAPLNGMLKKGAFQWTKKTKVSFEELKQALMSPSVLKMPNFEEDYLAEYKRGSENLAADAFSRRVEEEEADTPLAA